MRIGEIDQKDKTMNIKVSIPLSYLDGLIRNNEQLNIACENYEGDIRKLRMELAECKKNQYSPKVDERNEFEIQRYKVDDIRRLFAKAESYGKGSYPEIRNILDMYQYDRDTKIKIIREATGCSLERATSFVEGSDEIVPCFRMKERDCEIQALFVKAKGNINHCFDLYQEIRAILANEFGHSNKLGQIKKVRDLTDCSLKDAKEFVEGTYNPVYGL